MDRLNDGHGPALTRLLRGEHLTAEERASLAGSPSKGLDYSQLRDQLVAIIRTEPWFPHALGERERGEAVDENIVIERLALGRFACHVQRATPLDPRVLAERKRRLFWTAGGAADFYLRWQLHLPGELDGLKVAR
jgi:hypothetical protein